MTKLSLNHFIFTFILIASVRSFSAKMDLETHNALISKLESTVDLDDKDAMIKHSQIALRLADLYSERARLLSLEKEGQGENLYKDKIAKDRRKSLAIYKKFLGELKKDKKGLTLLQISHLQTLLGEKKEAEATLKNIIENRKDYPGDIVALSQIELGDIYFYRGNYQEALKLFENSLLEKQNPRRAYASYRSIWCYYNLSQTTFAEKKLIDLLKNKKMFTRKDGSFDLALQEELSNDLAIFIARNDIKDSSINTLSNLSPESSKEKNLIFLAKELDRTGKKKSALVVWQYLGKNTLSFEDKVEGQVQITRIQYDLGKKSLVLKELDLALLLLQDSRCNNNEECNLSRQNLRRIITDWGKAEERESSAELISAFQKYTSVYDDFELCYWAGNAALRQKRYKEAFELYKKAALLCDPKVPRILEGSLLGLIESAENLKNPQYQLQAYELYLKLNPQGAKRFEVRYQIAHWYYKNNQYEKASSLFYDLALDKTMPKDLKDKSSELCLDSYVLLKEEPQLEKTSLIFSKEFPAKQGHFLSIWRKSILNQTASLINSSEGLSLNGNNASNSNNNNKNINEGKFSNEWNKLNKLSLASWPLEERKKVLKNKLLLSYQIKNIEMLQISSLELLKEKSLSQEDRNLALHHLAWTYEMKFEFKKALSILKQTKPSEKEKAQHIFKLALLAELSNMNPSSYYQQYLSLPKLRGTDLARTEYAAYQLVKYSAHREKAFIKYSDILSRNPVLYASAGLFAYERNQISSMAQKIFSRKAVYKTAEGQLLARSIALTEFNKIQKRLNAAQIITQPDRELKRTMAQKIKLINDLERATNEILKKQDTSLSLIYLSQLTYENDEFAKKVLNLPIPKGIKTEADRLMYEQAIEKNVNPYVVQTKILSEKTNKLWEESIRTEYFKGLFDWSLQKEKSGAFLAKREIQFLKHSAEQMALSQDPFINFTAERLKMSSEAEALEKRVSENPFDFDDLEKLKSLQEELGRGPMVAYLNARLQELGTKGGRK